MRLALLGAVLLAAPALAHDHTRPDLDSWFSNLKSGYGLCCAGDEATRAVAAWDTEAGGYKVQIEGEWYDVPAAAVVQGPNYAGHALLWWAPERDVNGKMTPVIRCFLSGSMG